MVNFTRAAMIARLAMLGSVWLVASGAQVSCGSGNGSMGPDPFPGSGDGPTLTTTLVLRNAAGTETTSFRRGEIIYFELTVRNHTGQPVKGTVGNSPADYLVFDNPGARPIWQWSEGKNSTTEAQILTILPMEGKVYGVNWNQDTRSGVILRRGAYLARGSLQVSADPSNPLTADELRSALKEFTVN